MERRRSLADLLAVAASKLLADMLDHLPLPRDHLQRLGDVLAQLAQPRAAAAKAHGGSRLDQPLARQMLGEGLARRVLAGKGRHIGGLGHGPLGGDLVLAGRTLEFLEAQFHLVEQPRRAFRVLAIELARQLGDLQSLMGDQSLIIGGLGLGRRQFRLDPGRPGRFFEALCALHDQRHPQRGDVVGEVLGRRRHGPDYPTSPQPEARCNHRMSQSAALSRPPPGARCEPGSASRSRRACRPTAPR
jgi:hypothetical protein